MKRISEQPRENKKIFFLVAMPRSGNTLFASIINQNPKIACTANSITFEIYKEIGLLKQSDTFINYPDHKSLNNVLDSVYEMYYKHWPQEVILDRGPTTPTNINLLNKHFRQPIRGVIIWRDLLDVLASYIKWFENEPTAFINKNFNTIEEKLLELMHKNGAISRELAAIHYILNSEYKEKFYLVRYEDLVTKPKETITGVYDFLGLNHYDHRYTNLDQFELNGISYDDTIVGKNMHTIKTELKLESNPYKKMIPQSIIDRYEHIKIFRK
tara:strand:+ start:215 stop:1024 length:810 start_codon:yes stop_codon:yes gene_type:complete